MRTSPARFGIGLLASWSVLGLGAGVALGQPWEGFGDRGGGPGGGGGQERKLVQAFDLDGNGRLSADERRTAIESGATADGGGWGGGRGRGRGADRPPATPGVALTPADVKIYADEPLYDPATLRTFFIEFENPAWEAELIVFNNTDVEVPATVTVDNKVYREVGIHFRGNSSFNVGNGYKRSLNLKFDFVDEDQTILRYSTLNFLNANGDPTFLRTVLSMHIARQYVPAPQANLVRVVINGENWGVYASAQQFDKEFLRDNFKTTKGTRWKVPQGRGSGLGGFAYVDGQPDSYRGSFEIKSKDEPAAWAALIKLAWTLKDTPPEKLEAALASVLDVDAYLRFLALDNAMASGDGFYSRAADYSLYLDPKGRFHLTFHDANEMFSTGSRGAGGVSLDPLEAAYDSDKPIIATVLAVPALRAKYLGYVREIAEKSLNWQALGPVVKQYRELIAEDVARDTRKLVSTEAFLESTADADGSLRWFVEERQKFLREWFRTNPAP